MKSLHPDLKAAIRSPSTQTVYLAEIDHPAGVGRYNSGVTSVMWGSDEFKALGKMGAVTGIKQTMAGRSQEVMIALASPKLDTESADIIAQSVTGHFAFVWQAFLTPEWQIIGEPIQLANITLDSQEVAVEESGAHVYQIKGYMTQFAARRSMPVYYSNETQQDDFPGDTGMDRMAELADKSI
jgi:hypothetical protein